jgi:glycosyltransferase involved in cell wall biosynthesis
VTIVICSKSAWTPRIRREHAIAASAAADGHDVVFVERPLDPRSRRAWLHDLRPRAAEVEARIRVVAWSTVIPGHRSRMARSIEARRLNAALDRLPGIEASVVVATQPWQWPAIARVRAARRVFDCADDWRALIPGRAAQLGSLYVRIAREADAVILASPELRGEFAHGRVSVVPNGVSASLLAAPVRPVPERPLMVYAGTLSERFDAAFLLAALAHLPGWSVELYGQCQYRRHGASPGAELRAAVHESGGAIRWCGPVERGQLAPALDRGRVLIAPHRTAMTRGQDSMKLYDYAARDRPVVCTPGALGAPDHVADLGVVEAATPAEFGLAVTRAGGEDAEVRASRRAWLQANRWDSRWPHWADAALGGVY